MRSMFYKYDREIDDKKYPPMKPGEPPKKADGSVGAEDLLNAKGDCLGVKASADAPFALHFRIEGEVEGGSVEELLETCSFSLTLIHGRSGEDVCSIGCEAEDGGVKATVDPGALGLSAGIYRMRLEMLDGEELYTLFSRGDGILSLR